MANLLRKKHSLVFQQKLQPGGRPPPPSRKFPTPNFIIKIKNTRPQANNSFNPLLKVRGVNN